MFIISWATKRNHSHSCICFLHSRIFCAVKKKKNVRASALYVMGVRRRLPINKYARETTERERETKNSDLYILNMHLHDSSTRTSAVCVVKNEEHDIMNKHLRTHLFPFNHIFPSSSNRFDLRCFWCCCCCRCGVFFFSFFSYSFIHL